MGVDLHVTSRVHQVKSTFDQLDHELASELDRGKGKS